MHEDITQQRNTSGDARERAGGQNIVAAGAPHHGATQSQPSDAKPGLGPKTQARPATIQASEVDGVRK
jgi:hypothetical protein